jgi:metal-dependent amidase/aminoacylase/carboxypeptidase family protein
MCSEKIVSSLSIISSRHYEYVVNLSSLFQVEYSWEQNFYLNMVNNRSLADCYKSHAVRLGVELTDESEVKAINMGSSDIGNVSHILPSLHPTFYFGAQAPEHSDEFANQAGTFRSHGVLR